MRTAGLDIGSRTIKLAVVEDGRLTASEVRPNTHDPLQVCQDLLSGQRVDAVGATGFGRNLFARYFDAAVVMEVRAAALGGRFLAPDCRTLIDIGGQGIRVVALAADGTLERFKVNDHCAAGTGRFLEVSAAALAMTLEDLAEAALRADAPHRIESTCTVFAESEVVALASRGVPKEALALGLHQSVAGITVGLCRLIPVEDPVVMHGGVAHNRCIRELLELGLHREITVPAEPRIVSAIGAALAVVEG